MCWCSSLLAWFTGEDAKSLSMFPTYVNVCSLYVKHRFTYSSMGVQAKEFPCGLDAFLLVLRGRYKAENEQRRVLISCMNVNIYLNYLWVFGGFWWVFVYCIVIWVYLMIYFLLVHTSES